MAQVHQTHCRSGFDALPDSAFVRLNELLAGVLPFSASTTWRKVKRHQFPQPIKVSEQITAWRVGEVRRWLANPQGYVEADGPRESSSRGLG